MNRFLKTAVSAFAVGAISLGAAWAGTGLSPTGHTGNVTGKIAGKATGLAGHSATASRSSHAHSAPATGIELKAGQVLAGAARVSIEPRPKDYNGTWVTEGCATLGDDSSHILDNFGDMRVKWPENPNCLYMGGYGIGPMNPITKWTDPYGLWVRSVAVSDGADTLVLTILDGTYYFGKYRDMCTGCGFFDLANELGTELGIAPAGLLFASTHSHTSPDFIGGWGGVPDWYMRQVADSIRQSVREAVGSMQPAVIEAGDELARPFNGERRDFYRSAEDNSISWFRVLKAPGGTDCLGASAGACSAIATVAAYAAHPVTADESTGIADADYPGVFESDVEDRFGGVGLFFETGLGNISPRGNKEVMGDGLAALIPDKGHGTAIENPDVSAKQVFWDQPVTNSGLTALGLPGFFDRPFAETPSSITTGKSSNKPCESASPVSVTTAVSAARIGSLLITGAPGEIFSNLSNTIEERNPGGVTMPLALVNDGLGYIMQSFETDHVGRQVVGFVGEVAEYEDAYSIDACFGDMVLETTLGLVGQL